MNTMAIKENLRAAQAIAKEALGDSPPPEAVAAVLNAITAETLGDRLDAMARDICRAAAVAAGG